MPKSFWTFILFSDRFSSFSSFALAIELVRDNYFRSAKLSTVKHKPNQGLILHLVKLINVF
jgi:hypothetical protein